LHPNKTSNMASPVCFVKQSFDRLAYNNHVDKLLRLLCSLLWWSKCEGVAQSSCFVQATRRLAKFAICVMSRMTGSC
jgi:hypothetical protein